MSQWTHVNGNIRVDAFRVIQKDALKDIVKVLGIPALFESSSEIWDKCTLPKGSEGSINYSIWENPDDSHAAAYSISLFGDLRDFGEDEVLSVKEWFENIIFKLGMVRNAVLEIEVEYGKTYILGYRSGKIYEFTINHLSEEEAENNG